MEAVAVVAAAFALAGGIVKATATIADVSIELHDASEDIGAIGKELQSLQALLGPVSKGLARFEAAEEETFAALLTQVKGTLGGALLVVEQIEMTLRGYKGGRPIWAKLKWVMFGNAQMRKLRMSLESYKVALGIGLHVMSISIVGEIKDDTEVIREVAEVIKLLQTDDILARLDTREKPSESQNKVERWLEKMADYTSYAETAYQATTVDPVEEEEKKKWADLTGIPDLDGESPGSGPGLPTVPETGDFSNVLDAISLVDSATESRLSLDLSGKASPGPGSARHTWASPSSTALGTSTATLDGPSSTNLTVYSASSAPPTCPSEPPPSPSKPVSAETIHGELSPADQFPQEEHDQQDLPTIDWSPLVPEHIPQAEFDHLVTSVKRDQEAIVRAQGRRQKLLSADRRKRLDTTLLSAVTGSDGRPASKRAARCTSLLARGAKLSEEFANSALVQVVEQRDVHTLAVLLRYGVDPDSPGQTRDCRQPLAVAAQSDTACLCALLLAGAKIKDADRPDVCGMFCQSGTQARSVRIFCSPLLAAFSSIRPQYRRTINVAQFWTAHFLLVNGANVETRTCTSVMELVVRHWPITSQYRITKHLLSFGIDTTSREVELQFRFAMEEGAVTLAKLLLEHGVNAGDVARRGAPNQDPVVLAAREKHTELVDLVLDREEVDHIHLFSLVHVYMRDTSSQGSDAGLERAIRAFVEKGPSSWTQAKEPWAFAVLEISSGDGSEACKTVEESVTLLELAERIVNKNERDRQKILRLLNSKV